MRLLCVVGGDRPRGADDRCAAFACYVVLACSRAFLRCLPVWEGISSGADVCLCSKFRVPLWRNHWAFRRVESTRFLRIVSPCAGTSKFCVFDSSCFVSGPLIANPERLSDGGCILSEVGPSTGAGFRTKGYDLG